MFPNVLAVLLGRHRRGAEELRTAPIEPARLRLFGLCTMLCLGSLAVEGLTMEERTELVRKFKYYHKSVRPSDRHNVVKTSNGTFFNLDSDVELLQSRPTGERLQLEIQLAVHYFDERLVLRELSEVIALPSEFVPWLPQIHFTPPGTSNMRRSIYLDPKRGQITHVFVLQYGWVQCMSEAWKHPFERSHCEVEFSTGGDERIFLRSIRDLRSDEQVDRVDYQFEEWPELRFRFSYRQTHWFAALANFYLPSLLLFSAALFAQLKRRKIQVMVTSFSLLALIVMQQISALSTVTAHHARAETITLKDVWMCGLLVHVICILAVDLVLPSRRLVYWELPSDDNGTTDCGSHPHSGCPIEEDRRVHSEDNDRRASGGTNLPTRSRVARPTLVRIFDDRDICEEASTRGDTLRFLPQRHRLTQNLRATSIDGKEICPQRPKRLSINKPRHCSSTTLYENLRGTLTDATAELQRASPQLTPSTAHRNPPALQRITVGRRKKLALTAILACYTAFLLAYLALILHAIST